MKFFAPVVAAALFVGATAQAATVTASPTLPQYDYLLAPAATSGKVFTVAGTVKGEWTSPWKDTTTSYVAIQAGGTVEYLLDSAQTVLSLVWGSPDAGNLISFFLGDSAVAVDTFNGQSLGKNTRYVTIVTASAFDRVVFSSSVSSFEYAIEGEAPAPVPLPAAALLLTGALASMGALRRRATA